MSMPGSIHRPIREASSRLSNVGVSPYAEPDVHAKAVAALIRPLITDDILQSIQHFGESGAPDALLIRNIPIDQHIPRTGTIEERLAAKARVSESSLLALAELMNCRMQSIKREQKGAVIQNISPVFGKEKTESAVSADPFRLHTDDAPEEAPCDFVMMLCLEGDENAKTSVLPLNTVINALPEHVITNMKKPDFEFGSKAIMGNVTRGRYPMISQDAQSG